LILGRSRRPPREPSEMEAGTVTESVEAYDVPVWSEQLPPSAPTPEPTTPSDGDGDESIYGGGSG
jgi:hypothetical protein